MEMVWHDDEFVEEEAAKLAILLEHIEDQSGPEVIFENWAPRFETDVMKKVRIYCGAIFMSSGAKAPIFYNSTRP